jgi:molybdenum cofactor synthesis domain-containing protein
MTIRFGLLTVSDRSSRGERPDKSGPALAEVLISQGWLVVDQAILPDELIQIRDILSHWCDTGKYDVILTTGGTGFSPRDVTPEATQAVIDRPTPGLTEAMRAFSGSITPYAMLSRAKSGICKRTLIINLPGSPRGATENLKVILPVLPHAIQLLTENPESETGHSNPTFPIV